MKTVAGLTANTMAATSAADWPNSRRVTRYTATVVTMTITVLAAWNRARRRRAASTIAAGTA